MKKVVKYILIAIGILFLIGVVSSMVSSLDEDEKAGLEPIKEERIVEEAGEDFDVDLDRLYEKDKSVERAFKDSYMKGCKEDSGEYDMDAYCDCTYDYLVSRHSFEEMMTWDVGSGDIPDEVMDAAYACYELIGVK